MLDNCMKINRRASDEEVKEMKSDFLARLHFINQILGNDAFRLPIHPQALSRPLFDGLMVAADSLWDKRSQLLKAKAKIRKNFAEFVSRPGNYRLIVAKANTADAVKKRIAVIRKYLLQQL